MIKVDERLKSTSDVKKWDGDVFTEHVYCDIVRRRDGAVELYGA